MSDNLKEVTVERMQNVCYHNTQGLPSELRFYFRNRPPSVFINNTHCRGSLMQDRSGTYLQVICPTGAHWRYTMDDGSDVYAIHHEVYRTQAQSANNLKVAKECGATENELSADGAWNICMTEEAFEAYTSRILASQQAAHDSEIARLKEAISMKDEVLNDFYNSHSETYSASPEGIKYLSKIKQAISASPQQVSEWEAKKQAQWNEESNSLISQQDIEIEALRAQVAMLTNMFQSVWSVIPKEIYFSQDTIDSANAKLANTQDTAEAYDREHAAKVLKNIVDICNDLAAREGIRADYEIACMDIRDLIKLEISELRASTKKEGE